LKVIGLRLQGDIGVAPLLLYYVVCSRNLNMLHTQITSHVYALLYAYKLSCNRSSKNAVSSTVHGVLQTVGKPEQ